MSRARDPQTFASQPPSASSSGPSHSQRSSGQFRIAPAFSLSTSTRPSVTKPSASGAQAIPAVVTTPRTQAHRSSSNHSGTDTESFSPRPEVISPSAPRNPHILVPNNNRAFHSPYDSAASGSDSPASGKTARNVGNRKGTDTPVKVYSSTTTPVPARSPLIRHTRGSSVATDNEAEDTVSEHSLQSAYSLGPLPDTSSAVALRELRERIAALKERTGQASKTSSQLAQYLKKSKDAQPAPGPAEMDESTTRRESLALQYARLNPGDKLIMQDILMIQSWLLTIKKQQNFSVFRDVLNDIKTVIFTPIQSRSFLARADSDVSLPSESSDQSNPSPAPSSEPRSYEGVKSKHSVLMGLDETESEGDMDFSDGDNDTETDTDATRNNARKQSNSTSTKTTDGGSAEDDEDEEDVLWSRFEATRKGTNTSIPDAAAPAGVVFRNGQWVPAADDAPNDSELDIPSSDEESETEAAAPSAFRRDGLAAEFSGSRSNRSSPRFPHRKSISSHTKAQLKMHAAQDKGMDEEDEDAFLEALGAEIEKEETTILRAVALAKRRHSQSVGKSRRSSVLSQASIDTEISTAKDLRDPVIPHATRQSSNEEKEESEEEDWDQEDSAPAAAPETKQAASPASLSKWAETLSPRRSKLTTITASSLQSGTPAKPGAPALKTISPADFASGGMKTISPADFASGGMKTISPGDFAKGGMKTISPADFASSSSGSVKFASPAESKKTSSPPAPSTPPNQHIGSSKLRMKSMPITTSDLFHSKHNESSSTKITNKSSLASVLDPEIDERADDLDDISDFEDDDDVEATPVGSKPVLERKESDADDSTVNALNAVPMMRSATVPIKTALNQTLRDDNAGKCGRELYEFVLTDELKQNIVTAASGHNEVFVSTHLDSTVIPLNSISTGLELDWLIRTANELNHLRQASSVPTTGPWSRLLHAQTLRHSMSNSQIHSRAKSMGFKRQTVNGPLSAVLPPAQDS